MRIVLLFPFPLNLIAALLIVPVTLVCGAVEEALRWLVGGDV